MKNTCVVCIVCMLSMLVHAQSTAEDSALQKKVSQAYGTLQDYVRKGPVTIGLKPETIIHYKTVVFADYRPGAADTFIYKTTPNPATDLLIAFKDSMEVNDHPIDAFSDHGSNVSGVLYISVDFARTRSADIIAGELLHGLTHAQFYSGTPAITNEKMVQNEQYAFELQLDFFRYRWNGQMPPTDKNDFDAFVIRMKDFYMGMNVR